MDAVQLQRFVARLEANSMAMCSLLTEFPDRDEEHQHLEMMMPHSGMLSPRDEEHQHLEIMMPHSGMLSPHSGMLSFAAPAATLRRRHRKHASG